MENCLKPDGAGENRIDKIRKIPERCAVSIRDKAVRVELNFDSMILRKKFDLVAADVWAKLQHVIPDEFKEHFSRLQIVIEDEPGPEVLEDLKGSELAEYPEELCGLYTGIPLPQTSLMEPSLFPGRVYLFRKALMEESGYDGSRPSSARLREEIAITLLHEIGHFFGLEEDDLERLGFD